MTSRHCRWWSTALRRNAGVPVHLRGVGDLLVRVARDARLGEDLEARARVAERPRRQLDRLLAERGTRRLGAVRHGALLLRAATRASRAALGPGCRADGVARAVD